MNIALVEEKVKKISQNFKESTFIFDLLLAYGKPKATITRLLKGSANLSKDKNEVVLKKTLYFRIEKKNDIYKTLSSLSKDQHVLRCDPRFIIVTDCNSITAIDTKSSETLDLELSKLNSKFDFFLPWMGIEKRQRHSENPVDSKAAEKLAKLFDLIKADNPSNDKKSLHALNVFLTRILFCFFAEDTEIFEKGIFTNAISSFTADDGSNLNTFLADLFEVLNIKSRSKTITVLKNFPYVNGGLFAEKFPVPKFTRKSRKALIEIGDLNWAEINPDIFGSMIQAVVHPDQRAGLGMHYTSVSNIMKVIEPLFLNDLKIEFEKCGNSKAKLSKLLQRISMIKVFDPACGSGNFLIIAYKELRSLEMEIFKNLGEMPISGISLSNYFGIEIDDFAHEVAILSMWLAEHQMDVVFKQEFGQVKPSLPLKEGGNIVCGNAAQMDWEKVCKLNANEEAYIIGNPPYLGARNQEEHHKDDLRIIYNGDEEFKDSDYVSCWLIKGANFIKGKSCQIGFVTTNSISQGEQVGFLWPRIFDLNIELGFAHQSFKWTNNAKDKAGVTCIVLGLRNVCNKPKYLFTKDTSRLVQNISPYLTASASSIVHSEKKPLNGLPRLAMGNMARDGGLDCGRFTGVDVAKG